MSEDLKEYVDSLTNILKQSERVVVFTGAGISTESGISDYRSQGGLWERFQPVTIQEFLQDEEKRKEYWRRKKEMFGQIKDAKPNLGHLALARLEEQVPWVGVITQNIDGFHQMAGSKRVLEVHGTTREVICWDCKKITSFESAYERLLAGEEAPQCKECNGLLKPNTISFGQALDPTTLDQAFSWARSCDLIIALGSTLIVEPAASLPRLARESGAYLIIVNREETPLDSIAHMVVHTTVGTFLDQAITH